MSLLGVHKSSLNKSWHSLSAEQSAQADRLIAMGGVDPLVASVAARLNVQLEDFAEYCEPKLKNLLPDPLIFQDCSEAAKRFAKAIKENQRIAIFADYDVDGAASAALILDYLRFFGQAATLYIPDRLLEGYGPNIQAMEALGEEHDLIICVDCGTLAHEAIKAAPCDVIVLDHHMAGEVLPPALVVNPNRLDEDTGYEYLCAASVVFLFLGAVNAYFDEKPQLMNALDLVALATIADVAPLIGVNRTFVQTGLKVLNAHNRIGLAKLAQKHRPYATITAEDIGFVLAPRLNAGGRLSDPNLATRLLTSQSANEADALIEELEAINTERRAIEQKITEEAIAQIEAQIEIGAHCQNFVYAVGKNWHAGVLGIVASRLKSHFSKPALALAQTGDQLQGSARSVVGVNLGGAVAQLMDQSLIEKGGGHKMAAGLTLYKEQLEKAMQMLDEILDYQSQKRVESLMIDHIIHPRALNTALLDKLEPLGPFGSGAERPIFAMANMRMAAKTFIKDVHIRYKFQSQDGYQIDVMAFQARGTALDIPQSEPSPLMHIAIEVAHNQWQGRKSVSVTLSDWSYAK